MIPTKTKPSFFSFSSTHGLFSPSVLTWRSLGSLLSQPSCLRVFTLFGVVVVVVFLASFLLAATTQKKKKKNKKKLTTSLKFIFHYIYPVPGINTEIMDDPARHSLLTLSSFFFFFFFLLFIEFNWILFMLHSIAPSWEDGGRWSTGAIGKQWHRVVTNAILFVFVFVSLQTGAGPDLCVVQTPLVTRHFQAWRQAEEAVPTRGCSNRSGVVATHEVKKIHSQKITSKNLFFLFLSLSFLWLTLVVYHFLHDVSFFFLLFFFVIIIFRVVLLDFSEKLGFDRSGGSR